MSSKAGSAQARPFSRRPSPAIQAPVWASDTRTSQEPPSRRLPFQRQHGAGGEEVAGAVVERLARQLLGPVAPRLQPFRMVQAVGVLHQAVEAAPACPRSLVPIGRQRDADDAGAQPRHLLGRKALGRDRAGPITLHENIGAGDQSLECPASGRLGQVDVRRQLAAAGVHDEALERGQCWGSSPVGHRRHARPACARTRARR